MSDAPDVKRAVVFVDGQNLFHAAREAFGYTYPNYDVSKLAASLCANQGWALADIRFYTGIPAHSDRPFWHLFWSRKLAALGRQGVVVFSRSLRYRRRVVKLPDGGLYTFQTGEEKGIDVRIALDVIALAHRRVYDVALVLSQDQDLSEVAEEIRRIARDQRRWIRSRARIRLEPQVGTGGASTRRIGSRSGERYMTAASIREIIAVVLGSYRVGDRTSLILRPKHHQGCLGLRRPC